MRRFALVIFLLIFACQQQKLIKNNPEELQPSNEKTAPRYKGNGFGKITGFVTDQYSGVPVPGCHITLINTNFDAAVTDKNGRFAINRVPVGEHDLKFSFIGYSDLKLLGVYVKKNQTTCVEIQLRENPIEDGPPLVIVVAKPQNESVVPYHISTEEADSCLGNKFILPQKRDF